MLQFYSSHKFSAFGYTFFNWARSLRSLRLPTADVTFGDFSHSDRFVLPSHPPPMINPMKKKHTQKKRFVDMSCRHSIFTRNDFSLARSFALLFRLGLVLGLLSLPSLRIRLLFLFRSETFIRTRTVISNDAGNNGAHSKLFQRPSPPPDARAPRQKRRADGTQVEWIKRVRNVLRSANKYGSGLAKRIRTKSVSVWRSGCIVIVIAGVDVASVDPIMRISAPLPHPRRLVFEHFISLCLHAHRRLSARN